MDSLSRYVWRLPTRGVSWVALILLCASSFGCTAMTNPIADGIPVRLLPAEILGPSKTNHQTIPLSALRQPPPEAYRLDAGDVLGIAAKDFIAEQLLPPGPNTPTLQGREQNRLALATGFPVTVQEDGKITLPGVAKVSVKGLTVDEARVAIQNHYKELKLEPVPREKLTVTLLHPRQHHVLVFRQEAQSFQAGQDGPVPTSKRNSGHLVDLPAYENDVLHALARTGGLPDLDAYNEVIIYRDGLRGKEPKADAIKQLEKAKPGSDLTHLGVWVGETIRIPLRTACGATLPFGRDDILLKSGDVVFLEARDEQVFFTAGLLPPGKHVLPRDHDLDVLEAMALVRGPLYNGAFGGSNLSGTLIAPGLGNPSPSLLVVLRRIPGRGQVPIAVDLRSAMRHPQERIVLRPGDVLVLQEKPGEAFARYMTQTFFNFNLFWNVFQSSSGVGVVDIAAPDRLSGRVGTFQTVP